MTTFEYARKLFPAARFTDYEGTKWALEQIPHFSQCLIMSAIAVERYILVCLPTRADQLLSIRNRVVFYVLITFVVVLLSSIPLYDIVSDTTTRPEIYINVLNE